MKRSGAGGGPAAHRAAAPDQRPAPGRRRHFVGKSLAQWPDSSCHAGRRRLVL